MERMKFVWPDASAVSKDAFAIVKKIRKSGFETYIAGGAVRDGILKLPIREVDIATSARPSEVEKLFLKTIPTGKQHGTITVRANRANYEVTTFRSEGRYLDARHPSKVKFITDPAMDAKRRDFTINALFFDPDTSEIIDFVNGLADISHKRIRLVGESEDRIKEDALRMLRAVRFAATLPDFELSRETRKLIQNNASLIDKISAERAQAELSKIILSPRAAIGFGLLDVAKLLAHVLPELKACQGVGQPRNQHSEGDVYVHSLLALEKVNESYDLSTRWAVLFHDLGKPGTKKIGLSGMRKITFYNHQNMGAEIAKKICQRLHFSNSDTEKICWLVKNHMVPDDFVNMKLSTRRKWGLAKHFSDLLRVYKADAAASLGPTGASDTNPRAYREGLKILEEIKAHPALKQPILSGNDVMKTLKIFSGPQVGKILRTIEEKKLSNEIRTKQEAINFLNKNKKSLLKL